MGRMTSGRTWATAVAALAVAVVASVLATAHPDGDAHHVSPLPENASAVMRTFEDRHHSDHEHGARFKGGWRLLAVSPDGARMAIEGERDAPHPTLVDLRSGDRRPLDGLVEATGDGSTGRMWQLAFHPDGRTLAIGCETDHDTDRQEEGHGHPSRGPAVLIVDVATGRVRHELCAPPGIYWSLAYRPDGEQLAAANGHDIVALWDARTYRPVATSHVGTDIAEVAFLPSTGNLLVGSTEPPGLVTLAPSTGEVLDFRRLPNWGLYRMDVDPQGERVALAYENMRRVQVRDLPNAKLRHDLPTPPPACVSWSPDGSLLAFSSNGGVVGVVDGTSGTRICTLAGSRTICNLQFHPDGRHVANPTWGGESALWDVSPAGRPALRAIHTSSGTVDTVWSGYGSNAIGLSTTNPPGFQLLDGATGRAIASLDLAASSHELMIPAEELEAAASPDLGFVATLDGLGRSKLYSLPDLNPVTEFEPFSRPKAVSARGRFVVLNRDVRVDTQTPAGSVAGHVLDTWSSRTVFTSDDEVLSATFVPKPTRPDKELLATSTGIEIEILDPQTATKVASVDPASLDVTLLLGPSFSPRGRYLAGGSQEGAIWVLDVTRYTPDATRRMR